MHEGQIDLDAPRRGRRDHPTVAARRAVGLDAGRFVLHEALADVVPRVACALAVTDVVGGAILGPRAAGHASNVVAGHVLRVVAVEVVVVRAGAAGGVVAAEQLTGALGEKNRGAFMLTKGMTTTVPWLEDIAARNGRPVMIAAMFVDPGDPERVFREIGEIEGARERGRELWSQVGCFPLGMEFNLVHPYPLEALINWRPAIEAEGSDDYKRVLADASFRQSLKDEMHTTGVPNRFSSNNWDHMKIMSVGKAEHKDLVGKIVGQLAREHWLIH